MAEILQKTINIKLKKHDVSLSLDIPHLGGYAEPQNDKILQAHSGFLASIQPEINGDQFAKQCSAEVNAVRTFFPALSPENLLICFAAWLSFVCAMDDTLETMPPDQGEMVLKECIDILECRVQRDEQPQHHTGIELSASVQDIRIQEMTRHLRAHCSQRLSSASLQAFIKAACVVLNGHIDEAHFLQGRPPTDFGTYLGIRCRTIALGPFFEIIKTEYLNEDWQKNDLWDQLQHAVSCAAGLQNDLIGLERDIENGEQMNGVLVLRQNNEKISLAEGISAINAKHNESVARGFNQAAQIHQAAASTLPELRAAINKVTRNILLVCETHLKWCASAKRYQIKADASNETAMVRSNGIFHGLPTYPEAQALTALVTGATGVSGYAMVKVLAASPRWRKIYCTSSRPPPDNFFVDLGNDAHRVQHVIIDFLQDANQIAQKLQEKIGDVDHIFYFSYMQPAAKSNVLDLWADADELARFNASLFKNFVAAIQRTILKPKRFMLQTGSKHYAFYLGPAAQPAFESDPRVLIGKNFYYEQEDELFKYCQSTGANWNVVRPSYIIGAVRDGTLNHLIGFGIYAAVQSHLKESLAFPGDYRAWDREQVQSTGLLNAYFEEWLALSGNTANEAFNIHDGLSFTWGRLWPLLGKWYKVKWSYPETDETKYRVMKLPYPQTPRGFGPQTTLNSTFSLLEWSLRPEVEQAWRELAHAHNLVLNPFEDRYRARIFSFADSAVIGDTPMTTSVRKAREYGFFGTVDSYHSIFNNLHELARLKLIVAPRAPNFIE